MDDRFDKMMRKEAVVLIVDNSGGVTGAFKSIRSFTQQLSGRFAFHFALPKSSPLVCELRETGVPVLELPFLELRKHWSILLYVPVLILNSIRMRRYCRSNGIQLVHINDLYNMTGLLLKGFDPAMRIVYHVRLLPSSYAGRVYNVWKWLIMKFADVVVAVSGQVQQELMPDLKGKVVLIHDFIPIQPRAPQAKEESRMEFVYPANYITGKGHVFAVEAFRLLKENGIACKLRFVGDDLGLSKNTRLREQLRNQVEGYGMTGEVRVEGPVENLEEVLLSADVVLNFSESESFSMVCYEAMMLGRPVIATDSGGPAELIENDRSGILIPNRDIKAMSMAMKKLATDGNLRDRLGRQAEAAIRHRVQEHQAITRLESVYLRLLG